MSKRKSSSYIDELSKDSTDYFINGFIYGHITVWLFLTAIYLLSS